MPNRNPTTITPDQCRAARALLNWSMEDLAKKAERGTNTIRHFEAGRQEPSQETLDAFRTALERAGVEFIPENGGGAGVRLAKKAGKGRK